MFLLGLIFGIALTVGVLLLLRDGTSGQAAPQLTAFQARQQLHDLERAAIRRMLDEAARERQTSGHDDPPGSAVIDVGPRDV